MFCHAIGQTYDFTTLLERENRDPNTFLKGNRIAVGRGTAVERKMMDTLKQWREAPDKKALLVIGARQVGKTYIIDQFGKSQYKNYLKLDMRKNPSLREIFASQDIDSIISELAPGSPDTA